MNFVKYSYPFNFRPGNHGDSTHMTNCYITYIYLYYWNFNSRLCVLKYNMYLKEMPSVM